ncbi:MAG: DUF6768 family protein, partial [Bacteroidota bacterium]
GPRELNLNSSSMKKEMERIDELIKETLNSEEAQFYDNLEEQGILAKMGEIYKGKLGWLAIIMNIMHLFLFGVFVYCLVQFLETEDISALVKWASAGFLCMIFMGMLKLYMWMQMDKNDTLREIKRLELLISGLANKLDK